MALMDRADMQWVRVGLAIDGPGQHLEIFVFSTFSYEMRLRGMRGQREITEKSN